MCQDKIHINRILKVLAFITGLSGFCLYTWGQVAGDYRTINNGNWGNSGNWQRYNGTSWVAAPNYPGQAAGAGTVTIRNDVTFDVDISQANAIGSLVVQANFTPNNFNRTLYINGGLTLSAGTLNLSNSNGTTTTVYIGGNVQISGGTITETRNAYGAIIFRGSGTQSFTKTGGTISEDIRFTVNSGAVLSMGTSVLDGSAGTFTLSSGAGLMTGHAQGISSSGATGSIQVTGTRSFSSGADYVYNGTLAQITGTGLPSVVNNLTVNNAAGVTLTSSVAVSSTLTLTSGTFSIGSNTLTLNGPAISGTPTNLATTSLSSLFFGGSAAGVSIPSSVTNLNNLTINNTNGVTQTSSITLAAGGVLTISNGILNTGSHILSVTNTSPAAIVSSPSAFINVTTGGLRRTLAANLVGTGNHYLFPVGESNTYKAINLIDVNTGATGPVLQASVSASGALTGDGTTISSVDPRCWSLINVNSGNFTRASVELFESGLDETKTIGMSPAISGNYSAIGGSLSSSSLISPVIPNPGPYFAVGTLIYKTFYSYKSGNWNEHETWTTDPSGTLQIGNQIPGDDAIVVILPDRTVTLTQNVATAGLDITIMAGSFLDQAGYRFTGTIDALAGQGTLRLATANFPAVTVNTFTDTGGGTTEYYNPSGFNLPATQGTYNNLTINTAGAIATQLGNITLNGNLYIKSGTFRINDNSSTTKRTLTINGSVTVDAGASFTVGNGVTNTVIGGTGGTAPFLNYYLNFHTVIVRGDFTNNGTVRFTNLTYPLYAAFPPTTPGPASGAASVYFQGASDNTLTCNGTTDFYNLIVNKGTDQTYKLTINSSGYNYFRLFGANTLAAESVTDNPIQRKALWIYSGTVVLKGSLIIPSLSEGTAANAHYYIPANGALISDGVDVIILSTADDYREVNIAYGVSAPDNATIGINPTGTNSSLYVFGKLQMNNGFLSTKESGGIVTSSTASGQIIINDGTVDAKQFLSATGSASYAQTGGLFILRGRFQRTPVAYTSISNLADASTSTLNTTRNASSISTANGSFNLENSGNIYSVSGGTIRIYDVTTTGVAEAFDVKSSTANINVTGGTVEIIPTSGSGTDATDYAVYSTAPVYNLMINRVSSTAVVRLSLPLKVLNGLNLVSGTLNANSNNLNIGGNFRIYAGTDYVTGTNITTFDGSNAQLLTVDLASALSLSSLTVSKPSGIALSLAGTQSTINISGAFSLIAGTLNDAGKTINVSGNVFNSGIHTGNGRIVLNGTATQTIGGGGVFNNVVLDNNAASAAPVALSANMVLNGTLTFSRNKLFDIGTFNLYLNSSASIVNGGPLRFVQTAGNAGDGGLTRAYGTISGFVFPVGVAGKYTPVTIGFTSAPATFGSVTIIPVNYEHPVTVVNNQSLTYFWRVKSAGFTGIPLYSVTHKFVYDGTDVAGTETDYVPALYDGVTHSWYAGQTGVINTSANEITDWSAPTNSTNFLDADYTAGAASSFGTPKIYYSRNSGLWGNVASWSLSGHGINDPPAVPPGANDIVIIGDNDSIYLATETPPLPTGTGNNLGDTYYALNKVTFNCASLQIEQGAVLDIQNNPGCTFASVLTHPNGNGKIRLTTRDPGTINTYFDYPEPFVYPNGDFSEFSANDGISEFYTINPQAGTYYTLPSNASDYGTVVLTPLGGSNIIMPNLPVVNIHGDLICNGSEADAWLAMSWNGEYTPLVAKSVTVEGNFRVKGGSFGFIYNGATLQRITINGDVYVAPNAAIDVWTSSTNNEMLIGGNIYNNSNYGTNTKSLIRFNNGSNRCSVSFFGSRSAVLTNDPAVSTTPYTSFYNVVVNKGTSPDTTITWNVGGTLATPNNGWLTLQNGTLVYDRTGDFNISTSTDFIIPASAGLTLNTPSNVSISNNSASETLYLNGRLRILNGGGNVYVGPPGNTVNNADIEYSGNGSSLIEIQSGNLIVNGQIRRPTASTNGILKYRQSGGNLVIYGNNSTLTKAKLEVLNDGSEFTMSGGTITIVRGGGTTFGDLYLRPSSANVNGGTVIFTQSPFTGPVIDAAQSYSMDANISLQNITVAGKTAGTARDATVTLMVSPLVLNGSLTIANGNSIFVSNSKNLTIRGNLNNNGTYTYGTNKTIFNGGVQSVTGASVTDFYDLEVSPVTSLTTTGSFTVNRNLNIVSGNLLFGSGLASVLGDLTNNGSYNDDNVSGGVRLRGSIQQNISGTGAFGRLELDNAAGARLTNDVILLHDFVLTRGVLDINKYLLTLGQNSLISGSAYKSTKMIKSDGVASSRGVLKFFPAGSQTFTFPVGVAGKYTPAVYTISASASVGSIRINPVNECHPSVLDPMNSLSYYWQIESSGLSGFNASLLLQYLAGDVSGTESSYVAARLVLPGSTWDKATPGPATDNVNEAAHTISFFYSGTNNLNGDYTAGADSAIPDEVPTYVTNSNGMWSNQAIWTPVGASPPCPAGGPHGCNVIIDHILTTDVNFISVLSTIINNEIRIVSPTYGHNLGNVDGDGKIYLENGNLPGGTWTSFTDCSGNATIEYGGTGTYTIVSGVYTSVPNLLFTGTGTRILPNTDLTVCKRLVIDGPVLDNSVNNRRLILYGTMERYNTGIFRSGTGSYPAATVSFAGTSVQATGGPTGNFEGINKFNNLEINNASGLNISSGGTIEVSNQLLLTSGVIGTTSSGRLILLNTSPSSVIPVGGSASSYVSGPLTKNIINGDPFIFPLGKGSLKGHKFMLISSAGSTMAWTAEYFTPNTTATSISPPLEVSNTLEYWSVATTTSASAKIRIGWDPQSELTPLMTENGISDMRVARSISGLWTELPSEASGDSNTGEVATTGSVSLSSVLSDFTTASITGTLARASFASFSPVCGTAGIPVSFISFNPISLNYVISYTIDGVAQPDVIVSSLPFTLPATLPGAYRLTGFRYNNGSGTGVADGTTVYVYAVPTTALAGSDQSLCGVSSTTLAGNNPAPYSGLWSVISGTGGSFAGSTQYNTVFNGVLGVSYTLRWTISNGPCTSYDDVVVSFPVVASQPGDFTASSAQVCRGVSGYVYSVPFVSGVIYNWAYSGNGCTINGTGNSVTLDFSSSATSGILSVTATNACGTSPARTINITVLLASFTYAGSPYCQNQADPLPVLDPGSLAGTFSSTPGLVFLNASTGQLDLSASASGTYTVTNSVNVPACGILTASSTVTISGQQWTGFVSSDWNSPGNWSCGYVPYNLTDVRIPDVANKPVINSGFSGEVAGIIIDSGSSLTVSSGTISIAGTVTNNGNLNVFDGNVILNGTTAQALGPNIFNGNTVKNLTVNNISGVTLQGPLNVREVVLVQNGTLASDGNLVLMSDASRTALIDGSGSGSVIGNVTMQRYLASGFGYKYISSPFQAATVSELGDDMDLGYPFPLLYRFEENSSYSGWVDYVSGTGLLNPLEGYAANFGEYADPKTIDITGVVSSGNYSVTLYNHDSLFTEGFNLVGNPYPSPVDWEAAGWTKVNLDDAIWYFRASTTDQYGGTYSSYINGVPSDPGVGTNIIPSMQGFFVHVSDILPYPVTAILGTTNSVRVNDLTHAFLKSAGKADRVLVRTIASFTDDTLSSDPLVVYFEDGAMPSFDSHLDAMKLMNTDGMVTNFYSVLPDGRKLSINALPNPSDTTLLVPLGLMIYRDGEVRFRLRQAENIPEGMTVFFRDAITGASVNMLQGFDYKVNLKAGDYNNRFYLAFLKKTTGIQKEGISSVIFNAWASGAIVTADVLALDGNEGLITIYDINGRQLFSRRVFEAGRYEMVMNASQGVYIIRFTTGKLQKSIKLIVGL